MLTLDTRSPLHRFQCFFLPTKAWQVCICLFIPQSILKDLAHTAQRYLHLFAETIFSLVNVALCGWALSGLHFHRLKRAEWNGRMEWHHGIALPRKGSHFQAPEETPQTRIYLTS